MEKFGKLSVENQYRLLHLNTQNIPIIKEDSDREGEVDEQGREDVAAHVWDNEDDTDDEL